MGGAEALYTGLNNLDRFAWLGSFSGAFVMWPRGTAASTPATPAPVVAPAPAPAPAAAAGRGGRGGGGAALDTSVFEKNFPSLDAKANSRIKYMVIACGTADGLLGVNRQFKTWLKQREAGPVARQDLVHGVAVDHDSAAIVAEDLPPLVG